MKLAELLTRKNTLGKELDNLRTRIKESNVSLNDNLPDFQMDELLKQYDKAMEDMLRAKEVIFHANQPIIAHLARKAELKSKLSLFEGLPTKQGVFSEREGYGEPVKNKYSAQYSKAKVVAEMAILQKEINELQNKIADYNSSTEVEF